MNYMMRFIFQKNWIIGVISKPDGMLGINLMCSNWNDRYEPDWVAEIYK